MNVYFDDVDVCVCGKAPYMNRRRVCVRVCVCPIVWFVCECISVCVRVDNTFCLCLNYHVSIIFHTILTFSIARHTKITPLVDDDVMHIYIKKNTCE